MTCHRDSPISGEALYYDIFLAMSILGIFFHGYFFAFHLLHFCVGNDILLRAIQSVTKNGTTLLWVIYNDDVSTNEGSSPSQVSLLILIIINMFSLAGWSGYHSCYAKFSCASAFAFFRTDFVPSHSNLWCDSPFEVTLSSLHYIC